MSSSYSEESTERAVYECMCGNQETFAEKEWNHLRWVRRRVGLTNLGEAVAFLTDCCDRPEYMDVSDL